MQEAFLRLWERWDRVSRVEDPTAYLFRTEMNVFRNRYRRAWLAVRQLAGAHQLPQMPSGRGAPTTWG